MKNLSCNSVIVDGVFCGPEIEEGTFHNVIVDGVFYGPEIEEGTFHNLVVDGAFSGTEIEEGTFHVYLDFIANELHRDEKKKCPCPPVELPEMTPKVSGKDEKKNPRNEKN